MVDLNSSVITQPWNLSVVSDNGTDQIRNLVAPAWVGSPNFEIDLKYAFFIVMGAVRFDVHDILSIPDLDLTAAKYFEDLGPRRKSVRPGPALIIWFAKRGHWIKIRKQDIDDKSKADTLQKALVLIQVAWMVIQCIARRISDLPLTLLEIHTMVHVVCAMILYACWFQVRLLLTMYFLILPH
ncbi:hypothetical protein ACHAQD_006202 [Fusarium lateritium]